MTSAEIVNGKSALLFDCLKSSYVTRGEVADVDIVAHTGAVRSVIIIAEYAELLALSYSHLSDIRHQIVRNTVRIFTDSARWVSADRIEIAQEHHIPFRVSLLHVHHHLFEHRLGLTVRVGALTFRTLLSDRNNGRITIYSGRT